MSRGKYIVLEGAQGAGKSTIASMVMHELRQLGISARTMHEPDGKADATTKEIRRLTQDPKYPMNTRTEVLLYNAARSQSLEAVRAARDSGDIVIVDRSYLTTLAVQFYGRGDIKDYQRLNDILTFAVGDMWPDMTIVLDAPVDTLRERAKQRNEHDRFDNLNNEMLERIRAGYLWEARQRNMPIVYATGRVDEVFKDVWRHMSIILGLTDQAVSEPTSVADLLAKSPAATVLQGNQFSADTVRATTSYYVPGSLPDDLQCDYCDAMERILSERRTLVGKLAQYFRAQYSTVNNDSEAQKLALTTLKPLLPVACSPKQLIHVLQEVERLELPAEALVFLPNGFANHSEPVKLINCTPRNELDLLPAMLYESLDLPMNEVKTTVEKWSYEVKSHLFIDYVRQYPNGKALAGATYEWDFMAEFGLLQDLPDEVRSHVKLQYLTPRYGYEMPSEVEAAGLNDEYDAIFDQSLQLQSTLQARGFTAESQYTTLLGHKQRWSIFLSAANQKVFCNSASSIAENILAIVHERHPLIWK